jgi:hypothetical protein
MQHAHVRHVMPYQAACGDHRSLSLNFGCLGGQASCAGHLKIVKEQSAVAQTV